MASAASASLTSAAKATASPPSARIVSSSAFARSRLRLTSTTRAPSRANSMATAAPLPTPSACDAAPVTMATLPSSRPTALSRWAVRLADDLGVCLAPVGVADQALVELAGLVARQLLHEVDLPRRLHVAEIGPGERIELDRQ